MSDKRYLYYTNNRNELFRTEIVRETKSYYYIIFGISAETAIHKVKLSSGTGWDRIHYTVGTPELDKKYKDKVAFETMIRNFHSKLDSLRSLTDPDIIKKVMEIEL